MLAHCLIDDLFLPIVENIYILIIVLLCLFIYFYIFLNKFLVFFGGPLWKKDIVCFNVFFLGKYYLYIYIYIYIYAYFIICLCIK